MHPADAAAAGVGDGGRACASRARSAASRSGVAKVDDVDPPGRRRDPARPRRPERQHAALGERGRRPADGDADLQRRADRARAGAAPASPAGSIGLSRGSRS